MYQSYWVIYVMRKERWGDGRILALRRRHRHILAVRAQGAPSAHILQIGMFRAVGVAFGNSTLGSS
jgi:hypothetical protein